MASSGYAAWSVIAGEQPTTAKWNILGTNDASFNTGNGFNDNILVTRHFATSGLQLPDKIYNPYKFSVYQTTNPACSTAMKVPHNTALFDTNSNFSTTNNRYTIPVSGFYLVIAQVCNGSAGMGSTEWALSYIYKNGVELKRSQQMNGQGDATRIVRTNIVTLEQFTAGDYIEHWAQVSGSRDISGAASQTFFEGFLVSAT